MTVSDRVFKYMSLGIVLPSNNPESYFTHFGAGASFDYLKNGLRNLRIEILLCAQPPWDESDIMYAMEHAAEYELPLRAVLLPAETPPRMCYFRQKAVDLWPNATVYMLADDNMIFSRGEYTEEIPHDRTSGECYAEVLDYMYHYPRCGLVQCHTTAPHGFARSIRPTSNGLITTNKGLFLRNVNRGILWPEYAMKFRSSLEETVAGYLILEQGYFAARQHQNPTQHEIHKIGADDALHSRELIAQNAGRWVQERYNDPEWEHEKFKFPEALLQQAVELSDEISFDPENPTYVRVYE